MAFVVAALRTAETRQQVKALLAGEGHSCAIFGVGQLAVTEARAGAPDLLIIDSQLTDMSAAQVRDAMRSQPETAAIPIVVCGPTDILETRHLNDSDGRVLRASLLASSLREAVTAALTVPAGDPPRLGHGTPAHGTLGQGADAEFAGPARTEDPAMRVLLVEDDASIAEPLIDGLARYGYLVDWVATGVAALSAPPATTVLLDLGLPDIDGLEVCRRLRRAGDIPVIMLTARGDECDRVVGLEVGADDYLAKPFSLRELVARMRAVSRRTRPAPAVPAQP
jgi:DNA-binding response OmpR family regulator